MPNPPLSKQRALDANLQYRMAHAVAFRLQLKPMLEGAKDLRGTVRRNGIFKMGIASKPFTSMGLHKITGMVD